MTLERDRQISIGTLQVFGRLQDHRLCLQQVQNVGEEECLCQKGQAGSGRVTEKSLV
uniref:Uncharacterized protein n=1 Tax=Lepeophtheirus salmonis TaxID=72036 RepID=A0A0K2TGI4_LEPSM